MSLYKGVVGFIPVTTCKKLAFFKSVNAPIIFLYLEHNHIKEQETVLY